MGNNQFWVSETPLTAEEIKTRKVKLGVVALTIVVLAVLLGIGVGILQGHAPRKS